MVTSCSSLIRTLLLLQRELCDISVSRFGKKTFLKHLFVLEGSHGYEDLSEVSERVVFVTCEVMKKLAGVESIQGLNAIGITSFPHSFLSLDDKYSSHHEGNSKPSSDLNSWCPSPQRLLVLDGIQVSSPFLFGSVYLFV